MYFNRIFRLFSGILSMNFLFWSKSSVRNSSYKSFCDFFCISKLNKKFVPNIVHITTRISLIVQRITFSSNLFCNILVSLSDLSELIYVGIAISSISLIFELKIKTTTKHKKKMITDKNTVSLFIKNL